MSDTQLHETETETIRIAPSRIIIEGIEPKIDDGEFAIKRVPGETVEVSADIFAEGHDFLLVFLEDRHQSENHWRSTRMTPIGNDRWIGRFELDRIGRVEYRIQARIDRYGSWLDGLVKKHEAGQDVSSELLEGSAMVRAASDRVIELGGTETETRNLAEVGAFLRGDHSQEERVETARRSEVVAALESFGDRTGTITVDPPLPVIVDPLVARFGAWYEIFPRSTAPDVGRHGTFRDLEALLPSIAALGFDVLYLPPIHPIGRTHRKGPNNTLTAGAADPGSPWAIGGSEGGHLAVLPELGTIDDFDRLVARARDWKLQVALDIAFQCSPDHPWVQEHPEWFRQRPDGTIKYAENPPKKYQDIYPLDFEGPNWRALWEALRDVFLFWIGHGVTIFRVDNPHTKPFRFWDWCISEVKQQHPEAVFLSEAFTRPKVMKRLAKGGFTQSYTYFTWRNTKHELTDYMLELTRAESREYMRPNFFANTPDILHAYLQHGGPPAFKTRLILATTLASAYGIYGPPFELCVGTPVRSGSEEYLDSEKYQVRHWDRNAPGNLNALITQMNQIRREHAALQSDWSLQFHHVDNDQIIAYSKSNSDGSDVILVFVNLDPFQTQAGWTNLTTDHLHLAPGNSYQVHDLIDNSRYGWRGAVNFVMLDPHRCPAHVFKVVQ